MNILVTGSAGFIGANLVMRKAPEKQTGEDGLPIPPYKVYNIGGGQPENLLDFVNILQEELLRAGVLPKDYDFEAHKQLVPMQPGDVKKVQWTFDSGFSKRKFGSRTDKKRRIRNLCRCHRPGKRLWLHAPDHPPRRPA